MKVLFPVLFLAAGALFVTGCGEDDLDAPVITLEGDDPQIIDLGGTYTELNATATDNEDGDITASIVIDASAVNTNMVGKYTVTYTVVDEGGNTGTAEREVWVRATADAYEGFYTVTEACIGAIAPYEIEIVRINDNTLRVTNLGDFSAGETVFNIDLSGDLYDVLTINDSDDTDPDLFCTASGELEHGELGGMHFNMSYTFDDGTDSFTCSDVEIEQL